MLILGIETSCDDTGIAIIKVSDKKRPIFNVLANVVSSQIKVHAKFGGVVPNLAAREHLKNIGPCLKTAFSKANPPAGGLKPKNIDLIAVTIGPGLIPSLLIGVNFAKALAYAWKKPIIGVNHLEGHIIAALNDKNSKLFPAIALLVSGGHTQLVLVRKIGDYKIVGETRDDAAGECFDKVARLLNLGYPGGPKIAAEAAKLNPKSLPCPCLPAGRRQAGQILNPKLPRPMIKHKNYDFSFSGLKTAVLYLLKDIEQKYHILSDRRKDGIKIIPELCAEVQQAIIDVLIEKTIRAAKEYKAQTVILSGGVAANEELRKQFKLKIVNCKLKIDFLVPAKNLCTDNGTMISMAGYFRYKLGAKTDWRKIKADANLRIG